MVLEILAGLLEGTAWVRFLETRITPSCVPTMVKVVAKIVLDPREIRSISVLKCVENAQFSKLFMVIGFKQPAVHVQKQFDFV